MRVQPDSRALSRGSKIRFAEGTPPLATPGDTPSTAVVLAPDSEETHLEIGPPLDPSDDLLALEPTDLESWEVGLPMDADDDLAVEETAEAPLEIGAPMDADPDASVFDTETGQPPIEVGSPLNADARDGTDTPPDTAEPIHIGPDLDADFRTGS